MKQLLHTPEGVRDIYNVECGKKLSLEEVTALATKLICDGMSSVVKY